MKEKNNYDQLEVNVSGDDYGINERLSKTWRTLNTLTGLGIRRCGLTVATCSVIFWSVVVPVALYGCKLWSLTGEHTLLLKSFQNYASKKNQRFYPRVPNACSLHSLGWIELDRLVHVKKLLFIRSILAMDHNDVIKVVFIERYKVIKSDGLRDESHADSIILHLINTANLFNLSVEVDNMVERGHMYENSISKKMAWERTCSLEDVLEN